MVEMRPTAIDLFCGCGGFSLGMIQAGFEVVAAIDNYIPAMASYWYNLGDENTRIIGDIPKNKTKLFTRGHGPHSGWLASQPIDKRPPPVRVVFIQNIVEVNGWDMLNAAGVEKVDVVIGSPPCQSFSKMNTKKNKGDFRDFLMFEYARLVLEINPDSFVLENVPPVANAKLPDGRKLIDVFKQILNQKDWGLYYEIQGMYPNADLCPQSNKGNQCSIGDF